MTRTANAERAPALIDGICELTLATRDPAALEHFYVETFGCEVISRSADRIWLACGPRTRLGLWTPGRKEFGDSGGSNVHFALSSAPAQLDSLRERLEDSPVRFEGPVTHDGGDRSLYVEDPEGNVVEVWDFFERGDGARSGVDALA